MANTPQSSFNTQLDDRVLWYDGDVSVSPERLITTLLSGVDVEHLYTTELNDEIKKHNKFSTQQILVKTNVRPLSFDWTFNKVFLRIDVEDFILEALHHEIQGMTKSEKVKRIQRTTKELELFKKHSFVDVLKLMIYITDTFEQKDIVWGVGRGSSVSSYVLYLIGVHDIDSVEYDLPLEDFLHV